MSEDNRSMTDELKEKLDIFFGEDEEIEEVREGGDEHKTPLQDLKSILLSLEWEITDEDLDRFITELGNLREAHKGSEVITLFIKLLDSIGKYIKNKKASAHPDAIKLLNSAFETFTMILETPDMGENEKKTHLIRTINEFKRVKSAILDERKSRPSEREPSLAMEPKTVKTGVPPEPPTVMTSEYDETMTPHEAFAIALQEIKKTIEKEFEALRAEIRMWRQGQ